ncbi:MAG: hypothetical protein GC206_12010 [Alphaproteobacteria bacterium]|nr:hypothetical protein [Alphaproteobacteria bacterium]
MRAFIVAAALALIACGPTEEAPSPAPAPAEPETAPLSSLESLSPRALLLECAGALVAENRLDPMADPRTDSAAERAFFTVLALMDKEPGLAGTAGREAARAEGVAWTSRPTADRAARNAQCLERFPG